ncbi:MAG: TIM-barrel domain-containing protein [Eubacterium sp.]
MKQYIEVIADDRALRLYPLKYGIAKIEMYRTNAYIFKKSLVTEELEATPYNVEENDEFVCVKTDKYSYEINKSSLTICVKNRFGKEVLVEKSKEFSDFRITPLLKTVPTELSDTAADDEVTNYKISYSFEQDEAIYGFGANANKELNLKNSDVLLFQHNLKLPMPIFVSSKGYAVYFDESCMIDYSSASHTVNVDCTIQPTYFIICADDINEVIRGYRKLTGKVSLLPKYTFGYVQSKERFKTQNELLQCSNKYKDEKIPLGMVVQDWMYWDENCWGQKSFSDRFPNPAQLVNDIHKNGHKVMISIWAVLTGNCSNLSEMEKNDFLLKGGYYNVFDIRARALYYNQLYNGIAKYGFDAYWTDNTEPFEIPLEIVSDKERLDKLLPLFRESFDRRYTNIYTLLHNTYIAQQLRKSFPNKRPFLMTRASCPGMQKENIVVWDGDTNATYKDLNTRLTGMLNYVITGHPYVNCDIGGFFVFGSKNSSLPWIRSNRKHKFKRKHNHEASALGIDDFAYQELYTRWLQLGAFLPMMRSHGTDLSREVWNFDGENNMFRKAIEKFIHLREQLLPYTYSTAYGVSEHGDSMIRPLICDYPNDEKVKNMSNQFLFGKNIMVAPVMYPMYYDVGNKKIESQYMHKVYLPDGNWYDFWSGEKYQGSREIEAYAPIDRIPVFVKEGSIIPLKSSDGAYDINVYSGKNCEFEFYDDDGETYEYQKGKYNLVNIIWDDAKKELSFDYLNEYEKIKFNDYTIV